jgi:flavin reductase (DIM6/NTAB) family NADH-FMN oxidoreductase RutF
MPLPVNISPYVAQSVVDGGVALVTSAGRGLINVMTVSFFAESSHLPVLLRVALAPRSLTHELVSESGWFGLSVLCHGQEELALQCGSASGRELPKFERWRIRYYLSPHGVPLLRDALTTSECRVVTRVPLHDHTLFIGEVVASFTQTRQSFRDPLLVSELRSYVSATTPDAGC